MGSAAARTTRAGRVPGRTVDRATDDDGQRIGVGPSSPSVDWLWSIQRLAGNRAGSAWLRERAVQHAEPTSALGPTPSPVGPGREPTPSEHNARDGVVPDRPWRVLRPAEDGYNCFAPSADGRDPIADLILYGDSPTQILHAARRADEPYGELTFSNKIGGGVDATPVIPHAPADIQSNLYGHALRSFRRVPNTSLDSH